MWNFFRRSRPLRELEHLLAFTQTLLRAENGHDTIEERHAQILNRLLDLHKVEMALVAVMKADLTEGMQIDGVIRRAIKCVLRLRVRTLDAQRERIDAATFTAKRLIQRLQESRTHLSAVRRQSITDHYPARFAKVQDQARNRHDAPTPSAYFDLMVKAARIEAEWFDVVTHSSGSMSHDHVLTLLHPEQRALYDRTAR
jgi:hypothetical protein